MKGVRDKKYKRSKFRIALLAIIVFLIMLRFVDILVYPDTNILPTDFFFAIAIAQLFFLWFDEVKERHHTLWVQKKRDELHEMKSKFTLIASHELLTPVTVIKLYLDLLRSGGLGKVAKEQEDAITKINKHVDRLMEIKDDLLRVYYSAPQYLKERLKPESVQDLIRNVAGEMEPFIQQRKQNLSVEVEREMPRIIMNARAMRQVLVNLLLNSIRFTPDNGTIRISAKNEEDCIRVEIKDNGIGIPKEKLDTIFESFYETQDIDRHSSGTIEFKSAGMGLGLTIAKRIIDDHNGKIWAESETGKSTTLIFTLPKDQKRE